jgi:hypothetical protein
MKNRTKAIRTNPYPIFFFFANFEQSLVIINPSFVVDLTNGRFNS